MITPTHEQEMAEAIATATGPLAVLGGGTRGMAGSGEGLTTRGLAGITLYEPGALTLVAGSGTPVAEIEQALSAENQRLAFEPMDHRGLLGSTGEPTIGGVVAANVSGPRRIAVGAARDFALGVRFVDGRGTIVKNGGRVMKNVTGYDLVKLMSGSFGTLGVLTEVALKVLPAPETEATLVLHGLDDTRAVAAMAAALGSPLEVTGAAHDPDKQETYLRVEGFSASVEYRMGELKSRLGVSETSQSETSVDLWRGLRDVTAFHGKAGDVWRVSCKPSEGPALAAKAGAEAVMYDWGGGLLWLRVSEGTDLRARLGQFDGHATRVRGGGDGIAQFHPEAAGVARLTQALRLKYDPRQILNGVRLAETG